MRFFLSALFFFCCAGSFYAQTDSLVARDTLHPFDSARPESSVVRFSVRNRGRQVNGLNVSMGRYDAGPKNFALYHVNGLDLSFFVDEQRINGAALSLLWLYADTLNGFGCGLIGGATKTSNGLFLYGIAGLSWASTNGISAAGLWQINTKGNGATISGISTVYDESYNGLLLSGLYNRVHKNFKGFGMSGAVQIFGNAKGFASSGALTVVEEKFSGFLFSGVSSYVGSEFYGVGISATTNTVGEEAHGLLVSAVNTAPVMQGVQIGIVNYTNRLQGVQLGLINVNRANPKWCRVVPILNFNFRPLHETDTIRKNEKDLYVLRSYNRNGRLASCSQYQNGKLQGVFTLYNMFNDKVRETNYHAGLKEGEEFFFDGAGRITESSFYHVDTLAWSSTYDYPDNIFSMFIEKTIYYGPGKEMIFGLIGIDTLYKFANESGYRVERDFEEYGAGIYKIYHHDSLQEIIWLREKWTVMNGPSPETIIHIWPDAIPAGGIVLTVDPLEYGWAVSSVAKNIESSFYSSFGYYFPLTVNAVDAHGQIKNQLIVHGKQQEFRLFDKHAQVKLQIDSSGATTFYRSGKIQNRFCCDSTYIMSEDNYVVFRRTDYYENSIKAFYKSQDSICIWDTKGRLKQFECNDTVRTYHEDGSLEYEVTRTTLQYFDSKRQLRLSGKGDTLYTFHNGQPDEMLIVSCDSVIVINVVNGVMKYNGRSHDYFCHKGKWIYNFICKEPFTGSNKTGKEDDGYISNGLVTAILELPKESKQEFDRHLLSPVGTPKWLEFYFWNY